MEYDSSHTSISKLNPFKRVVYIILIYYISTIAFTLFLFSLLFYYFKNIFDYPLMISCFSSILACCLCCWIYKYKGVTVPKAYYKSFDFKQFLKYLAIAFALSWTVNLIFSLFSDFLMPNINLDSPTEYSFESNAIENFFTFFYIGIAAPVVEEILCRGLMIKSLLSKNKTIIIFASAFVFSITHMFIPTIIGAMVIGIVLAYYVLKTKDLIGAILIHIINNCLTLTLLVESDIFVLIIGIFLISIFVYGYSLLYKSRKRINQLIQTIDWKSIQEFFKTKLVLIYTIVCLGLGFYMIFNP